MKTKHLIVTQTCITQSLVWAFANYEVIFHRRLTGEEPDAESLEMYERAMEKVRFYLTAMDKQVNE